MTDYRTNNPTEYVERFCLVSSSFIQGDKFD